MTNYEHINNNYEFNEYPDGPISLLHDAIYFYTFYHTLHNKQHIEEVRKTYENFITEYLRFHCTISSVPTRFHKYFDRYLPS